jgi:hypothetical protein
MSDAPGTGSGGIPASSPAREHAIPAPQVQSGPPEMSERDILAGIEGLLEAEDKPAKRRPVVVRQAEETETRQGDLPIESPQGDAGPEEATGESEEERDEPDADAQEDDQSDHPIDPPNSWLSREDRAIFEQLPPEAQAVIARRESEQNKAFTQKTQEIAEHRKALESTFTAIQSERQQYAQERQQYEQNLQQLLMVAMPEAEQFARIDWQKLASDSPADYVRLTAQRDALRGRVGAIQGELARVEQQRQVDAARQAQEYAQQFENLKKGEAQRLAEKLPDFGDPEKGKKLAADLRNYLQKKGFAPQEIGQVIDHRVILVAEIAMRAEQVTQARRSAETKRSDAAPTVQRPGSTQGRETNVGRRRQERFEQLRQSGSQRDALGYLMEIL